MASYLDHTLTVIEEAILTWTLPKPAGVVEGTPLIMWLAGYASDHPVPTITGWTNHGGYTMSDDFSGSGVLYTKVAGASEPASYGVTWDFEDAGTGVIVALQDADPVAPFNAIGALATPAAGTSHTTAQITPSVAGCLIVTGLATAFPPNGTTFTAPGGTTQRENTVDPNTEVAAAIADVVQATAAPVSLTWDSTNSTDVVAFVLAIAPTGPAPPTTPILVLSPDGSLLNDETFTPTFPLTMPAVVQGAFPAAQAWQDVDDSFVQASSAQSVVAEYGAVAVRWKPPTPGVFHAVWQALGQDGGSASVHQSGLLWVPDGTAAGVGPGEWLAISNQSPTSGLDLFAASIDRDGWNTLIYNRDASASWFIVNGVATEVGPIRTWSQDNVVTSHLSIWSSTTVGGTVEAVMTFDDVLTTDDAATLAAAEQWTWDVLSGGGGGNPAPAIRTFSAGKPNRTFSAGKPSFSYTASKPVRVFDASKLT